jgi:hypothetical protein
MKCQAATLHINPHTMRTLVIAMLAAGMCASCCYTFELAMRVSLPSSSDSSGSITSSSSDRT